MISGAMTYKAVNAILALTGLVSIVLAFKLIPDKRTRNRLIIAFSLMILGGILMPICLKLYSMGPMAHLADLTGRTEGMRDKLVHFKELALLGYLFEVAIVGLFVGAAKKMLALRAANESGVAEQSGEEA